MAHSIRLWLETQEVLSLNPGRVGCLLPWLSGCAYTVLQTARRSGVCSAVYGSVHYKEHLKSFDKSTALSRLWASLNREIAIIVQKAT